MLEVFDRYVFESIVEKVIVGGYDKDGNKDTSMLTFIYKTGFKNSVDGNNFKPPRKNSKAVKEDDVLYSQTTDEVNAMYSHYSHDTRRKRRAAGTKAKRRCVMKYSIIDGAEKMNIAEVMALLKQTDWADQRPVEQVRRAMVKVLNC